MELRAWLEQADDRLVLRVDDTAARYPVVIDPFVEAAKLTAFDGAAEDLFGSSVGISGDIVVVGAPDHNIGINSNQGAAYVFQLAPCGDGIVDSGEG